MHLVIDIPDPLTWRERLARAPNLQRCSALTRGQRLARAFFWAWFGAAVALIAAAVVQLDAGVAPVKALAPEIVHVSEGYTVYRLRFAWRAAERSSCELTVFHDRPITWSLTCEPR